MNRSDIDIINGLIRECDSLRLAAGYRIGEIIIVPYGKYPVSHKFSGLIQDAAKSRIYTIMGELKAMGVNYEPRS